jgi:hypothetical protein
MLPMSEVVIGVSVFTALCLATRALRLYGIFGLAILSMLFPVVVLVLAFVAATVFVVLRHPTFPKEVSNAIRSLFVGRR